jgi:hypothetical protein
MNCHLNINVFFDKECKITICPVHNKLFIICGIEYVNEQMENKLSLENPLDGVLVLFHLTKNSFARLKCPL